MRVCADEDALTRDQCSEVLEIMSMFDVLDYSYEQLADKAGIQPHEVEFPGFDGNYETALMGYVQYFCSLLGRTNFERLQRQNVNRHFNSHVPLLDAYRRMVRAWQDMRRPSPMDGAQIRQVLDAVRAP